MLNDNKRFRELDIITLTILKGSHRKKLSEVCVAWHSLNMWPGRCHVKTVCVRQKHSNTVHQRLYLNMQRVYKVHLKEGKQKRN